MLENILNNVNATQETLKPRNDVKKSTEDSSKTPAEDSFKNLLEKNLSKDDKSIKEKKTEEKPKSIKSETSAEAQNGSFSHLSEKDSPFANITKTDSKNTPSNPNQSSPTKDLLSTSLEKKSLAKNNLQDTSTKDIKSTQNSEKKLSDIKTLADEKDLKAGNIKLEKKDIKSSDKTPLTNNSSSKTNPPSIAQSSTSNTKDSNALNTNKPMTQNLLDQKLKTTTTSTIDHKKDSSKPLSSMLKTIDEKELKTRKKFNQDHKIEYKTEDKTEKIAIIERGKNLPKNIVEPKLYQEKRAAKLEEMDSKRESIQEAINNAITKDIKLKNSSKDEKTEDTKEAVQKKTKKSSSSSKAKSQLNGSFNDNNTKIQAQDQNKQIQNQIDQEKFIDQEKTLQSSVIQKNKKTTEAKEVEKTKDKTTQDTSVQKDSNSTLGAIAKNDVLYKSANAKETIKNFAQSLSEEIKNYKPPLSKLSLELNPEKLGKVELTIKQIGNNLHVSVVSNNQAIALFVQNQVDLRQNLAMIGFSGVDLNFSSQDNSQKENQDSGNQKRNKNSLKEYEEVKNISQTPYDTMEIVLPKYA